MDKDTPGTLEERLRAKVWTTNRAGSLLPSQDPPSINIEAADEIASLRAHVGALLAELDKTERRSCKSAGHARQALNTTPSTGEEA